MVLFRTCTGLLLPFLFGLFLRMSNDNACKQVLLTSCVCACSSAGTCRHRLCASWSRCLRGSTLTTAGQAGSTTRQHGPTHSQTVRAVHASVPALGVWAQCRVFLLLSVTCRMIGSMLLALFFLRDSLQAVRCARKLPVCTHGLVPQSSSSLHQAHQILPYPC
jgi:hypothetical protein